MTVSEALPIALEFLGDSLPPEFRWKTNTKCFGSMIHGTGWDGLPRCTGGHPWDDEHDIPCPPLTDALAIAMLRTLFKYEFSLDVDHQGDGHLMWRARVWPCWDKFDDTDSWSDDPAHAIVLAVAALARQAS